MWFTLFQLRSKIRIALSIEEYKILSQSDKYFHRDTRENEIFSIENYPKSYLLSINRKSQENLSLNLGKRNKRVKSSLMIMI